MFAGILGDSEMPPKSAGTLSGTLKFPFAAGGSLATTIAPMAATAAPVGQPAEVDPARWADAFNGWSVGFGVGYDIFRDSAHVDPFNATFTQSLSPTLSGKDPFADFQIGRDFRAGGYVFGLYGDIFAGENSASFASSQSKSPSGTLKLQEGAAVTARAGFTPNQQSLFYGLAGWTWQHYEATLKGFVDSGLSTFPFSVSGSGTLNGPTVGIGYEMLFPNHPSVSFKTEYRYTHFDAPGSLSPDGVNAMTFRAIDDHSVRFILSFKTP